MEQEKLNILDFIEMQEIEFGIIMFLLRLKKPTPYISPAFIKAKTPHDLIIHAATRVIHVLRWFGCLQPTGDQR